MITAAASDEPEPTGGTFRYRFAEPPPGCEHIVYPRALPTSWLATEAAAHWYGEHLDGDSSSSVVSTTVYLNPERLSTVSLAQMLGRLARPSVGPNPREQAA